MGASSPPPDVDTDQAAAVRSLHRRILAWYRRHGRHDLPWRHTREPWLVLLAELMLQRTRADLVVPVYVGVTQRYPTAAAFAAANNVELDALLRPLGLEHRFGRIRDAARAVARGVPRTVPELLDVPGVGPYAAHATACFAYGQRVPIVDPSVIRIFERLDLFQSERSRPRADPAAWEVAAALLPQRAFREWNLALLDLGALVCRKRPLCGACPALELCPYGLGQLE